MKQNKERFFDTNLKECLYQLFICKVSFCTDFMQYVNEQISHSEDLITLNVCNT